MEYKLQVDVKKVSFSLASEEGGAKGCNAPAKAPVPPLLVAVELLLPVHILARGRVEALRATKVLIRRLETRIGPLVCFSYLVEFLQVARVTGVEL